MSKKRGSYSDELKGGMRLFAAFQEKLDKVKSDPTDNIYHDGLNLCFTIKLRNLENEMKDLLRLSNNPHAMPAI